MPEVNDWIVPNASGKPPEGNDDWITPRSASGPQPPPINQPVTPENERPPNEAEGMLQTFWQSIASPGRQGAEAGGRIAGSALEATGAAAGSLADLPAVNNAATAAQIAEARLVKAAATTENQARAAVSRAFAKGVEGGAATAPDVLEEFTKARAQGQPMSLVDVENAPLGALAGTTYRQGGAARQTIKGALDTRAVASTARVEEIINRQLSDLPYRATAKKLAQDRSARSAPIWSQARAGGSIAPLQSQFEGMFNAAAKSEATAQKALQDAQNRLTQARAGQATAGNVYAASGANREASEVGEQFQAAQQQLAKARSFKAQALEKLRRAQADGTANAPGAVWSPRLQEFLDTPEVQQGIRRGFAQERRAAVGAGKPFNPKEYAVIGQDEAGNPIVGEVPNMSLLMVGKEGLDAAIEGMHDPLTGRLTKDGRSFTILRDGLVDELDRLNPLYKQARDVWAGDTATIRAMDTGKNFMKPSVSPEELAERVGHMSDSERQFFTLGVADALKNRLFRAGDSADKGRALIRNEDIRMRLRPLFHTDEQAEHFISALEREHIMSQSRGRVMGGSQTVERAMDQGRAAETAMHAAHGIMQILEGRWLAAAASGIRLRRMFGGKVDDALSSAVARLLVDPNISLNERGTLAAAEVPRVPSGLPAAKIPSAALHATGAMQGGGTYDNMTGQMP